MRSDLTSSPLRVLLADGGDGTQSLAELFRFRGYETYSVRDGHAALDCLETFQPDVFVFDLGAPLGEGLDIIRTARQVFPEGLLIVAHTTWVDPGLPLLTKQAGADLCLLKPVQTALWDILLRAVPRRDGAVAACRAGRQ